MVHESSCYVWSGASSCFYRIIRLWLKNGCLQLKIYTSKLLNLSVETMNSIVEDVTESSGTLVLFCSSKLNLPYANANRFDRVII